jgi:hypothetical protein
VFSIARATQITIVFETRGVTTVWWWVVEYALYGMVVQQQPAGERGVYVCFATLRFRNGIIHRRVVVERSCNVVASGSTIFRRNYWQRNAKQNVFRPCLHANDARKRQQSKCDPFLGELFNRQLSVVVFLQSSLLC